MPTGILVSCST